MPAHTEPHTVCTTRTFSKQLSNSTFLFYSVLVSAMEVMFPVRFVGLFVSRITEKLPA